MQYLVGDFDGVDFIATSWGWLDHGHDFHAGVTFAGLDEPVMIGWLHNWSTAETTPTHPWRGMTALTEQVHRVEGLDQRPAEAVASARTTTVSPSSAHSSDADRWKRPAQCADTALSQP